MTANGTRLTLPGREARYLMRKHNVTIKELAARMDITQKRVRYVRAHGVAGVNIVRDWVEAITQPIEEE